MYYQVFVYVLFYLVGSYPIKGGSTSTPENGLKLVIDHDGGADDALAISMSLLSEKYLNGPKVVALTTSYGNINGTQSTINSAKLLKLCDRSDIPIYAGAQKPLINGIKSNYYFGYDGLGDEGDMFKEPLVVENVHAAIGLIGLSKKYKGDLVIMAIGPLTNIALATRLDPDFISRLSQLYIGAGHVHSKAYPNAEFNAAMDPEAYSIVSANFQADKVTIVPFSQVYESLNITREWRLNVLGAIDTPIMKALNGYERLSLADSIWNLLDAAVAAMLLDDEIVKEYKYSSNGIHLCGNQRGVNTNNFESTKPNSRVVYSAILDKYKKRLVEIYSAELLDNPRSNCSKNSKQCYV